ncbi:alginate lyase family protein [Leisingera aquaemixtae]|uniref:alginate lyase family protein n=1 Tax=Leisingera aquaemixtae TaxID=1396826 RepID=UPI0021BD3BF8|nr:alginate lyase family protein [Leisingera aquaemixtae]
MAEAEKQITQAERRRRRKIWRRRILILLSPLLLLLSPILLPVYFFWRKHRDKKRFKPGPSLGSVSGSLSAVPRPETDTAAEAKMDAMPDRFALCRIIGNDLVPRHRAGQSLENVKFILENEPEFEGCTKLWLLNRIFDPENEARLIELLESHGQKYERLPYDHDVFMRTGYDFGTFDAPMAFADGNLDSLEETQRISAQVQAYRAKNNYVMHNNGARNAALEMCIRSGDKWALPFDGNCYFTKSAFNALKSDILENRDKRYFVVPMARMTDNADLLNPDHVPNAVEEPQIAFRCDAPLRFDEAHPYGRRPKVEMLLHLGVTGPWERWPLESFDTPPRPVHPEGHRAGQAGWVARLFSGQAKLETEGWKSLKNRGLARSEAIQATLDMLEARSMTPQLSSGEPVFFDAGRIEALSGIAADPLHAAITSAAEEALTRGPFSVTDKPEPGPSGDLHDYFHPAPYWWPDPKKKDGLPYIKRDGERVPGTLLYEAESDRYDRTRLQRLFDDTTALALAGRITGEDRYREHAERQVRTWFVDPGTGMNPNLTYAQVCLGRNGNKGQTHGLIETKDFYFFLDALRLLDNPKLTDAVKPWFREFHQWFATSEQGIGERKAANNHGTCFDLQDAALSAFLGDTANLQAINLRAQARLLGSITPDGVQPHEMDRTLTQHYCAFNLQSWVNLFTLLEGTGLRPWDSAAGERLVTGLRRTLKESIDGWTAPQISPFEAARLVPLDAALKQRTGESMLAEDTAPACFFPHDGIAPFWRLTENS